MVGRNNNDVGFGVDAHNAVCTPSHAWGSVAVYWFGKQLYVGELGQLLAHNVFIQFVGVDIYVLWRKNLGKPVVGLLQLCASGAEEVDKLLGTFFA